MSKTQSELCYKQTHCRACKGVFFNKWLSLGDQPPANNLLETPSDPEAFFPLDVYVCDECGLVQLLDVVNPRLLFDNYLYYSSTASSFRQHFQDMADDFVKSKLVMKGDLVVDIGSNDGILLKPFKEKGLRVVGVEPAKEIAKQARDNGILTIDSYLDRHVVEAIRHQLGQAQLVTATNVFAHADDLDEICVCVNSLLSDSGVFVIEVAYLPKMLEMNTFDLIYHEHICYYTQDTIESLLVRNGLKAIKFEDVSVHGGSLRVYAQKMKHPNDCELIAEDEYLPNSAIFDEFPKKVAKNKKQIKSLLLSLKQKGKRVIGYGAPAKMSTMTNYFEITPDLIEFIIDDSPAKQGKYSPGMHIPIVAPKQDLSGCTHDYVFIFAWNFAKPIMETMRNRGYKGEFIIPFPTVTITTNG